VKRDPERTYDFTVRAYSAFKWVFGTVGAIAAFLFSLAALKFTVNPVWLDARFPLWGVALVCLAMGLIFLLLAISGSLLVKDALLASSAFKGRAEGLASAFSELETLAYIDPITGIENTAGLSRRLTQTADHVGRVLILLDLKRFGKVNKKFNHWKGDEYLRAFAKAISDESRRSEYVFKDRSFAASIGQTSADVRAFRKASGSDEFFILLNGDVGDALGYLNRIMRRRAEFEAMSRRVLGGRHAFGLRAGVVPVAPGESPDSAVQRASECLMLTRDARAVLDVYWPPHAFMRTDAAGQAILESTEALFRKARH
jgi:GGDEF domain-containing protein